jgi:hypothetical protein
LCFFGLSYSLCISEQLILREDVPAKMADARDSLDVLPALRAYLQSSPLNLHPALRLSSREYRYDKQAQDAEEEA